MNDILIFLIVLVVVVGLGLGGPLLMARGMRKEAKGFKAALSGKSPWKENEEQMEELSNLVNNLKESKEED